jgi:Rps23 Pro-64 3,4-dihydroxylase Tpa1-like proline 4-hydroxylase
MKAIESRVFPYGRWDYQLPDLAKTYQQNLPYPHIALENFLDEEIAQQLVAEFPKPTDTSWIHYKHFNENKLGKTNRKEFPATIGRVIDEFNSPEFLAFVSKVTGIPGLMADPSLEGGGMHQTEPGGFLNMHADFTMHHHHKNWRRRVNLILYLNPGWQESWGGELQLWDKEMRKCVTKCPPIFNQAVFFNTTELSFHGYPDPIKFPAGTTRRSLALYYYTPENDPNYVAKSTNYKPRPGESKRRALMIWLDKTAVHCYSVLKKRLGLSDDFAGKILGIFSRKRK